MKELFDAGDQLKFDVQVIVNVEETISFDVEELQHAIDLFIRKYLKDGDVL